MVILDCLKDPQADWSIVRKTLPALKATVLKDFLEVLEDMQLSGYINHHETKKTLTFHNGATVEYFSIDDAQKVRGRKRRKCWINECNEIWSEDFTQLNIRTVDKLIFDYNPSEVVPWIENIPPDELISIHSTYKDNPFLEKSIAMQIENLKLTDPIEYDIYALGIHATSRENVYQPWQILDEKPERFTQYCYGLDFGYVHPTALLKIWYYENERYIEEVLYESYLEPPDLMLRFEQLGLERNIEVIADHARADLIAMMRTDNYYVLNADKDVQAGIAQVRSVVTYVNSKARNVIKENKLYKHKKINGEIRDKEVHKRNDDAMDSYRYANMWISKYSIDGLDETITVSLG